MGRIKTKLIKRITHKLIDKYPEKFTASFDENKKILANLIIGESKKIRNAIAGYITRLKQSGTQ